jgi:hypothetical protein
MLTNYPFYFSSIRNLTAVFGSLFNNIKITRVDNSGNITNFIRVPLSYSSADKTISMLKQTNRLNGNPEVKMVLPRISFELTGMTYDSTRKITSVQKNIIRNQTLSFDEHTSVNITDNTIEIPSHNLLTGRSVLYKKSNGGSVIGGLTDNIVYWVYVVNKNLIKLAETKEKAEANNTIDFTGLGSGISTLSTANLSSFVPIPYNFEYSLNVFVKYIDDGLQIIEQILPYFTPFYTVTLNDFTSPELKRDVNVTLSSVTQEDVYEGLVEEDRTIQWTLTFVANSWIYPPISDTKLIKIAETNFFDLNSDQKLISNVVSVDPITANKTDQYTINTNEIEYI